MGKTLLNRPKPLTGPSTGHKISFVRRMHILQGSLSQHPPNSIRGRRVWCRRHSAFRRNTTVAWWVASMTPLHQQGVFIPGLGQYHPRKSRTEIQHMHDEPRQDYFPIVNVANGNNLTSNGPVATLSQSRRPPSTHYLFGGDLCRFAHAAPRLTAILFFTRAQEKPLCKLDASAVTPAQKNCSTKVRCK